MVPSAFAAVVHSRQPTGFHFFPTSEHPPSSSSILSPPPRARACTPSYLYLAGFYLVLVSLKAHQVFTTPPPMETGAPYANVSMPEYETSTPSVTPLAGIAAGPGRRVPMSAVAPAVTPPMVVVMPAAIGSGSVVEATGKLGGGSVGGPCGPRRLALTETVAHLAFLSAMAVRHVWCGSGRLRFPRFLPETVCSSTPHCWHCLYPVGTCSDFWVSCYPPR